METHGGCQVWQMVNRAADWRRREASKTWVVAPVGNCTPAE